MDRCPPQEEMEGRIPSELSTVGPGLREAVKNGWAFGLERFTGLKPGVNGSAATGPGSAVACGMLIRIGDEALITTAQCGNLAVA